LLPLFPSVIIIPAADEPADLVDGPGGEAVAVDLQARQILGQTHLEAQDFQGQIGLAPRRLSFTYSEL
jgi:hypothetical protein